MQQKPRVIAEFNECPICHHTETLAQIADKDLKEAGRIPKEKFSSLAQEPVALTDPRVGLSVETLILHHDACAKCGFPYYTRAERAMGMVKMIPRSKG